MHIRAIFFVLYYTRKIPYALKTVFENFEKRCNLVVSAEGGHIEEKYIV